MYLHKTKQKILKKEDSKGANQKISKESWQKYTWTKQIKKIIKEGNSKGTRQKKSKDT